MKRNTYEYWQNASGKWNFRLRGKNGEVQYSNNQGYNTKTDCLRGIKDAKRNSRFAVIRQVLSP